MLHIGIHLPGLLTLALAIRLPGAERPSVPPPAPAETPARKVIDCPGATVIDFATRSRSAA